MTIRFADKHELTTWNQAILANPDGGNVFQSLEYSNLKKRGDWKPHFLFVGTVALSVLEKNCIGLGKVWYIMKGPGVVSPTQLKSILTPLRAFAKKQGVFTIKIEPEILKLASTLEAMTKLGLVKTNPIQPNISTVALDISPSLDQILITMPQKGRYAIKRAERDGVTIKRVPATNENCRIMFDLLQKTAIDSQFGIRAPEYYKEYWQTFAQEKQGQLFFAYFEGAIVAGAYAFIYGKKSTYKDGASIRERTAYGASHLLQWHVITWAKEHGSLWHDLCGAPPADRIKDPTHPHYGIGLFKTQFNKDITEYVGAYDIPVIGWKHTLWHRFLEKLVRKVYYKLKHESYY